MTEKHHKPGSGGRRHAAAGAGGGAATTRLAPSAEATAGPEPFTATELRQVSTHITTQWFLPVEGNRLTLLEIDPWRVHAYWNVAEADLAAARTGLLDEGRDAVLVLRFTDLSPGTFDAAPPHPRFDVEVQQARNNWYIGLWRDAKHYSAELGLRAPAGRFVGLVRSNEVVTPRSGPSPEVDFRHLEVRPPRTLQAQRAAGGTERNDTLLRDLFPKRLPPVDDYPLAVAETAGGVVEEPPFPAIDAERGDVAPAAASWEAVGAADARSDAAAAATAGAADAFPVIPAAEIEPYRALARRERARVLARIGPPLPPVAEEGVSPTVELQPQPLPIPPGNRPVDEARTEPGGDGYGGYSLGGSQAPWGGASVWQPAIPLEAVLAAVVSSPGQGEWPVQASVELVVRGRNTSASPLTLCGERVEVGDDGTFTLRLPLEQGTELAELIRRLCSRYGDKDGG